MRNTYIWPGKGSPYRGMTQPAQLTCIHNDEFNPPPPPSSLSFPFCLPMPALCVKTVEGRTDNEPTFYFNATTNESTFDKPQELMLPEELMEHKRFLEYKETSEK